MAFSLKHAVAIDIGINLFCHKLHNICIYANNSLILQIQYCLKMISWGDKAKRLLKSELIKRGISNADLALMLNELGVEETKASIDSKMSRGSFSATFFLQCLTVIGCCKLEIEDYGDTMLLAADNNVEYKNSSNGK